jgi:hypothetical protein
MCAAGTLKEASTPSSMCCRRWALNNSGGLYGQKFSRAKPFPDSRRKIPRQKEKSVDAVPIPVMPIRRHARRNTK